MIIIVYNVYIYLHVCIYVCIHKYTRAYNYICIYAYTCVNMYIYKYIIMYTYIRIVLVATQLKLHLGSKFLAENTVHLPHIKLRTLYILNIML